VESDHHHTEATPHLANVPEFLRDLHGLMARVMNAKWGRKENLWNTDQTSVVELATPGDAFRALIYAITNPAKDHLVRLARDWPGISSVKAEFRHGEITVRRPHWYFDKSGDMPPTVTLRFTRPPGFAHLTEEQWWEKVDAAVEAVEQRAARQREERKASEDDEGTTTVLGRKAILRQSPFDSANSDAPRSRLNPTVKCRNKQRRKRILEGRARWLAAYRKALAAYRNGDKHARFPPGTYQLRVATHVRVAAGPGPLVPPYATTFRAA
jgi:hypothetical protein